MNLDRSWISRSISAGLVVLLATFVRSGERLQFLRNGGFEEDEMTFRGEPASSCGGWCNDQWYNMQDRFPDGWRWPGVNQPSVYGMGRQSEWPRGEVALDADGPHAGQYALRLQGRKAVVQQTLGWNSITDLYRDGPEAPARRLKDHTAEITVRDSLFQDLLLTGWARTRDVPEKATARVQAAVHGLLTGQHGLPKGTTQWQRFEVLLSAEEQAKKAAQRKGVQKGIRVDITLGYASRDGAGQVWFDDLALAARSRPEPNLLPNSSFEAVADAADAPSAGGRGSKMRGAKKPPAGTPYPKGWSAPVKWTYLPPPYYYVWNNWQHFFTPCRGYPKLDTLVARSGPHSLRLDLLPGDEYALESPTIVVNQQELRPIEAIAWVKADRLRHLDLMLIDQDGRRLPACQTLPFWGGLVAGTHDWIAVRKLYQGFTPVKSVRLRIGARGFNGSTKADIGRWHAYNQVSTVWIDDVALREVYSTPADLARRGVSVPREPSPAPSVQAVHLDLGERLFGENAVKATVRNRQKTPAAVELQVSVVPPNGKGEAAAKSARATMQPGRAADLECPYNLSELSQSWQSLGQLRVGLLIDGVVKARETYWYGTWPAIANVRPSKAFLDETENPILVAINLGVAQTTLSRTTALSLDVIDRRTGRRVLRKLVTNIRDAIASAQIPHHTKDRFYFYVPRVGLLDHRNLILEELDVASLPPRPWNDPESDWLIRVTGLAGSETLFVADSHPFARLTKFDEVLPPVKEVSLDRVGHFFRINGKPFFVFAHSHGNGAANGGAPPSRSVGFNARTAKANAMNGLQRWAWLDASKANWDGAQVYTPMLMAGFSHKKFPDALQQLENGQLLMTEKYGRAKLYPLAELNQSAFVLAYFLLMDEAIVEAAHGPEERKALLEYARAARGKVNRPIGIMDNHSQFYPFHDDDGLLDPFDALYFEREAGSVFRPELALRNLLKRKKRWVMVDLPQTYENVPHQTERYRAFRNTLHGFRGWFGIQGCADPSLYRGLRGEFEHVFTFLSANEGPAEVSAAKGISAKAWKKGNRVLVIAEQHNPIPHGQWEWVTGIGGREAAAHTGVSRHLVTPIKEGYAVHGYNDDVYREVQAGDAISQEVYLAPENVPPAIFLIVPGNGGFNHVAWWGTFDWADFRAKRVDAFLAAECYSHAEYGINWYRTKRQDWLDYQAQHRFPQSCFRRLGDLPKPGQWTTLSVPVDTLGLAGRVVDGLMFMTSGNGVAYWGRSTLVRADGAREALLDGRIGREPEQFRQALLKVAGMGDGRVRVIGENRSVPMRNGSWTDDLMGEDLFGFFADGYLGDGITYGKPVDAIPEALALGYTYDNSPRCVRVYELIPDR